MTRAPRPWSSSPSRSSPTSADAVEGGRRVRRGDPEADQHGRVGADRQRSHRHGWNLDDLAPACRAALLMGGRHAVLSHGPAARLHGLDGFDRDDRIVVTGVSGHSIRSLPGVETHRCGALTRQRTVSVDGLRCVARPVVLIQIAATDGRDAAATALDGMLRDGNAPRWIRQTATAWQRRRVAGPPIVLQLLHERIDARLPRSWFQRLAKHALSARSIETVDEHPVRDPVGGQEEGCSPNSTWRSRSARSAWSARAGDGMPPRPPRPAPRLASGACD